MPKPILLLLFFLASLCVQAQQQQVSGKVTTTRLEPLAFVSVQVKGARSGTITKQDGSYTLMLEQGHYELVFSMIGFTPQTISLTVTKDVVQNVILETDN